MLTTESVLALAPDDASAKAARGLTAPAKWPLLGADEAAAWGECQGSGSKPYQTQVDFNGPAFRCSCPSRKFPCKHGLALLLMRAQNPALFNTGSAPAWVTEWLASRAEKAQKKEERQAEKAEKAERVLSPAEAQAQAEREAQREGQRWQRIERAAQELQRWLADQITRGLGALGRDAAAAWHAQAARLVDAQAPGLAQRLRDAAANLHQGEDWPERTLHRLGLLQLACEALQRRSSLDAALQADLRTVVGWPLDKAEVLAAGEQLQDRWTVLGLAIEDRDDKLVERRVWLQGERSGRRAWLLDHAFGGRGFEQSWVSGSRIEATLAFFPGASRLRALCVAITGGLLPAAWPHTSLDSEWQQMAERHAACPWVSLHPLLLCDAHVLRQQDRWWAVADGQALALRLSEADAWILMACSGGHPIQLAGEWNGRALNLLTAWRRGEAAPLWQRSAG